MKASDPSVLRLWPVLLLLPLGGCADDDAGDDTFPADVPPGPHVVIPVGAFDPNAAAPFYVPDRLELTVPGMFTFVNNDTIEHVNVGTYVTLGTQSGVADDHGEGVHDHGEHGHGLEAFDVTTGPGEWARAELTEPGRIAVHCHPHPWMTMDVLARLASPVPYEIVWTETITTLTFDGELAPGETASHAFVPAAGPVARVTAVLRWDDSEDDVRGPDGQTVIQSEPDTLSLTLGTTDGAHEVTNATTARQGTVLLTLPSNDARAQEVMARDPDEAWQLAGADRPGAPWLADELVATVSLDAVGDAVGPVGPLEDPGSSYDLTIEIVHATAHPVGPGASAPADAPGVAHADHDGHDHEH